jgi:hypothetical protein
MEICKLVRVYSLREVRDRGTKITLSITTGPHRPHYPPEMESNSIGSTNRGNIDIIHGRKVNY